MLKLGLIRGTWSAYDEDQCTVVITREHHMIYMRYPYISVIERFSPSNLIYLYQYIHMVSLGMPNLLYLYHLVLSHPSHITGSHVTSWIVLSHVLPTTAGIVLSHVLPTTAGISLPIFDLIYLCVYVWISCTIMDPAISYPTYYGRYHPLFGLINLGLDPAIAFQVPKTIAHIISITSLYFFTS